MLLQSGRSGLSPMHFGLSVDISALLHCVKNILCGAQTPDPLWLSLD
jgi:hypothetical protein